MPLNDTVYSICNNKVQPEYYVDLGVTPKCGNYNGRQVVVNRLKKPHRKILSLNIR